MRIPIDLNANAFNQLVHFCSANLKESLDPIFFASCLVDEANLSDSTLFEIRGFYTKSGNPVTISFGDDDLVWEEIE